ncbi:hypothetical protein FQN60_007988 [Etheostoma spectabile]|uniref:Uncharacterized protein n=1 Tax=Etheostoma spectabile TaxID=54343 RepID=A0A5J5CTT9_9PERO|nr:hypothetical protein FQN60_007988 [Etheostoma spectabile]
MCDLCWNSYFLKTGKGKEIGWIRVKGHRRSVSCAYVCLVVNQYSPLVVNQSYTMDILFLEATSTLDRSSWWLRGFLQSKPGAALDDPWPTGRVEGSARTPLPIHGRVPQTH